MRWGVSNPLTSFGFSPLFTKFGTHSCLFLSYCQNIFHKRTSFSLHCFLDHLVLSLEPNFVAFDCWQQYDDSLKHLIWTLSDKSELQSYLMQPSRASFPLSEHCWTDMHLLWFENLGIAEFCIHVHFLLLIFTY